MFATIFTGGHTGDPHDITRLLKDWSAGDREALEQLTPRVYRELYTIARAHLRRLGGNHTLQPTAVINEAYVRLLGQPAPVEWVNRSHFYGIAAHLMRTIVVDYTRTRNAAKRGSGSEKVTFDDKLEVAAAGKGPDLLAIDGALNALAARDPRKAQVLEMHYFGGMTREEIAGALNVSLGTVKRDLSFGTAWMRQQLLGEA